MINCFNCYIMQDISAVIYLRGNEVIQCEVLKEDFYGEIAVERRPEKHLFKTNPRLFSPN